MPDIPKYKRDPPSTTDARTFTRDQAARQLDVSIRHVDRLIKLGQLRAVRIGRLIRIPRDALDELLQGGAA